MLTCPFSATDIQIVTDHLLANIASPANTLTKIYNGATVEAILGAVVAAPAIPDNVFSQDYYFFWVRDGAIVMRQIVDLYKLSTDPEKKAHYKSLIVNYLTFVRKIQDQPALNNVDILSDPKFNVDGTVWVGNWFRPQNDGAAYQALALTDMANLILDESWSECDILSIYDPSNYGSLLKENLEYTAAKWDAKTVGPWEEVLGNHFSVRIVQRAALLKGAALAIRLNDSKAAQFYSEQAKHIANALEANWNSSLGYYAEMLTDPSNKYGGVGMATLIGLVYAQQDDIDDHFAFSCPKVMSTAFYVRSAFENLYLINVTNRLEGHTGPLIGRYASDVYDGNQSIYGNPWFLCTNLMAAIYYGIAEHLLLGKAITVNFLVLQFLQQIAPTLRFELHEVIDSNNVKVSALATQLMVEGDEILKSVKNHCATYDDETTLHMSEQIDRASGQCVSATDLSWSYETLLKAVHLRERAVNLMK